LCCFGNDAGTVDDLSKGCAWFFILRPVLLQAMMQMQQQRSEPVLNPMLPQQQQQQLQRPQPGFGSQGFQQRLPEQLPGVLRCARCAELATSACPLRVAAHQMPCISFLPPFETLCRVLWALAVIRGLCLIWVGSAS
jgi:hypothetical protein